MITEEARSLIGANLAMTSLVCAESDHASMNAISTLSGTKVGADTEFMPANVLVYPELRNSYRPTRLTPTELEENSNWNAISKHAALGRQVVNGWLGAALLGKNGRSIQGQRH